MSDPSLSPDTPEPRKPELSIIVPFLNEEGNILPLTRELTAAMRSGPDYELIYVDDGSSDGTADEIMEALKLAPAGRMLRHDRRGGKTAALWNGFKYARAPWIQLIDGDMQQDPRDIVRIWNEYIAPGADPRLGLISGARIGRHDGRLKWLSSRIANGVRRAILDDDVKDVGCAFKLLRTDAALDLVNFGGMHRFIAALIKRGGWTVAEVRVTDRPRHTGQSKYKNWDRLLVGIIDLIGMVWLRSRATFRHVEAVEERAD